MSPAATWLCFAVIALLAMVVQVLACSLGGCSAVLISDAVTLSRELDNISGHSQLGFRHFSYVGVIFVYWAIWQITPFATVIVNLVLILLVLVVLDRLFCESPRVRAWAYFGVLANPYLWFVASGPNKEIPLLLITTLYFVAYVQGGLRGTLYALLLAAVATTFRDGYGVLLAGLVILNSIVHSPRKRVIVTLLCAVFLAGMYNVVANVLPAMKRNLASTTHIAEAYDSTIVNLAIADGGVWMDVGLYLVRLAANGFSLPVRPQFMMIDGSLYPVGIAFWIYGVILAAGLVATVYTVVMRRNQPEQQMAALPLQILMAVSVSLFVQPRYLMVVLPFFTALLGASKLSRPVIVVSGVAMASLVAVLLSLIGVVPVSATGVVGSMP